MLGLGTGGVQQGDPSLEPYWASEARAECSVRTWGRKADWRPVRPWCVSEAEAPYTFPDPANGGSAATQCPPAACCTLVTMGKGETLGPLDVLLAALSWQAAVGGALAW